MKIRRRTRRSLTSGITVAALVGGLFAVGTVVGAPAAQAAVGASWAAKCTTPLVFVSQGGGNAGTQLYTQQYTDTGGNFVQVGNNTTGLKYNSIAFNTNDNYIYGIGNVGQADPPGPDGSSLLKIDSTGTVTPVGLLTYNGGPIGSNHGAFDPAGNYYAGGGGTAFYKVTAAQISGANNPNATIPVQLLSGTGASEAGSDFTYADGYLWAAGNDGTVYRTDLGTLVTTAYPNVVKSIDGGTSAYGAAWTYGNGTLGFDANTGDNSTGLAVQTVDITGGTPTFVRQVSGPGSGNNDGTSCSLPADLSLTKTINNTATSANNRLSVQPGAGVTWRIGVTNNGPGGSSQQFVTDTVPAGVTGVSVTAPNGQCSVNGGALASCATAHPTAGQTLTVQFGYLAPTNGSNTRGITVTATAPPGVSTLFDNTATVAGNEADAAGNNTATAYATTPSPSFTLSKSGVDTRTLSATNARVGDAVQYTFGVQNTSSVVLSNLVVSDPKAGGVVCDSTAISPVGQANNSTVCHANYVITQADFDAGLAHNVATATATAPGGATVNAGPASFDITMEAPASSIALTKTATPNTGAVVGTNVGYTFVVKNTGTVSLSAVTVTDPMFPGITCPIVDPLVPQASVTCSPRSHAVTQAEFDAGTLPNTASANATPVRGAAPAASQSTATVTMAPATNAITVTKTGTDDRTGTAVGATPGDTISYTFVVKNNSNVTLTGASIADPLLGVPATCVVPAGGVGPGGTATCTAPSSYTFTQNDFNAGSVVNTATATGTYPRGGPATATNTAVVAAGDPVNSVSLDKTVVVDRTGTDSGARVGDKLSYGFVVTNTGNTALTTAAVTDPRLPAGAITCAAVPAGGVPPLGTLTCQAPSSYTVTQADVDAGTIQNTATVGATFRRGNPATATDTAVADAEPAAPGVTLTKTGTVDRTGTDSGARVGDTVSYAFVVTNSGNISLTTAAITDPLLAAGAVTCDAVPVGGLQPGATLACRATSAYTVVQADVDRGTVTNTATVAATFVRGANRTATASAVVDAEPATNAISLEKSAADDRTGTASGAVPGDKLSYTFVVTNNSNLTLTGVSIADPLIGNAATCAVPPGGVAPQGTVTCTAPASYTVTQDDFDAGSVVNDATATGTYPRGPAATATDSAIVSAADPVNTVGLAKSVTVDRTGTASGARVGDKLSYAFVVTNTGANGSASLTGAVIVDPLLPAGSVTCAAVPSGGVKPGGTLACVAPSSYTVTQADFDAGTIPNTATVTATYRRGPTATATASALATADAAAPAVNLTKTATDDRTGTDSGARVGDTVSYGFTVLNSGDVSLTSASIADPLIGTGAITCPTIPGGKLAPGDSIDCSAPSSHTVTQDDVDAGTIPNTATVTATFSRGANQTDDASAVVTAEPAVTAITLTKTATDDRTATNSGARTGDTVSYGFHVVNDANVSLATVAVTDPLLGAGAVTCPAIPGGKLAPGASIDCTATSAHTITQAEFDAGLSTNTATVDATFVRGAAATDDDTANVTAADPTPSLGLVKSATVDPASRQTAALAGDSITYSFVVTNTGDISVDTLSILDVDPNVGLITCAALPDGPGGDRLAPGSSVSCAATTPHVITQREFDAQAPLVNTASALARPLRGVSTVGSPESTAVVTLGAPAPGLGLVKTGTVTPTEHQGAVEVGDTVGYSYIVTNTGNVTMYGVDIADPHVGLGPITCPDTSGRPDGTDDGNGLAPGKSLTCTTAADGYTVTQADVDYGYVYDQATPTGYYLPGDPGTPFSGAPAEFTLVAAPAAPSIGLVKSAAVTPTDDQDGAFTGDTIAYSFLVTNTGNITVRDVSIEDLDPTVGKITCPDVKAPGIAPAGTTTCTADVPRTVTQAEFDLQAPLVNTATASAQPLRGPDTAPLPIKEVRAAFPQLAPPAPTLPARVVSAPSSATVPLGKPVAGLVIVKTATIAPASDQKAFKKGDRATFTFAVTNTGNVTMTDIVVADPKAGAVTCPSNTLAPGATVICAADAPHVFTQADVDNGSYTNSAVATGTPPPNTDLPKTPSVPDTVTVTSEKADPSITLVKTAHVSPSSHQGAARPGDTIGYTFLVTNTGNVTLTDVGVDDPTGGPVTCPRATLAPGESMTCRTDRTHTVTASEAGTDFVNRATAFGTPPQGMRRVSSSTATATVTVAEPPVTPTSTGTTAMTGVDAAGMVGSGILCLLLGALMLLVGLRRREGGA